MPKHWIGCVSTYKVELSFVGSCDFAICHGGKELYSYAHVCLDKWYYRKLRAELCGNARIELVHFIASVGTIMTLAV